MWRSKSVKGLGEAQCRQRKAVCSFHVAISSKIQNSPPHPVLPPLFSLKKSNEIIKVKRPLSKLFFPKALVKQNLCLAKSPPTSGPHSPHLSNVRLGLDAQTLFGEKAEEHCVSILGLNPGSTILWQNSCEKVCSPLWVLISSKQPLEGWMKCPGGTGVPQHTRLFPCTSHSPGLEMVVVKGFVNSQEARCSGSAPPPWWP